MRPRSGVSSPATACRRQRLAAARRPEQHDELVAGLELRSQVEVADACIEVDAQHTRRVTAMCAQEAQEQEQNSRRGDQDDRERDRHVDRAARLEHADDRQRHRLRPALEVAGEDQRRAQLAQRARPAEDRARDNRRPRERQHDAPEDRHGDAPSVQATPSYTGSTASKPAFTVRT